MYNTLLSTWSMNFSFLDRLKLLFILTTLYSSVINDFFKRIWDEQFVNTFCRQWRSNSCRGKQLPSSRVEGFLVGGRRAWSRVCSRPDVEEERVGVTRLDSRLWLVPNSHFHGGRNLERNQTIGWNGPMENNKVNWLNTVNIVKHTQFVNTERVILRMVQVIHVHVYSPKRTKPTKVRIPLQH